MNAHCSHDANSAHLCRPPRVDPRRLLPTPLALFQVLTGSRDATVRVWNIDCEAAGGPAATCTSTLLGHTHFVGAVGTTADGSIVSGSNDKHIIVWDTDAAAPAHILTGHTDVISCVRACPVRRPARKRMVYERTPCAGYEPWLQLPLQGFSGFVWTPQLSRTVGV